MTCFLPQATFRYSSTYWSDYEEFNQVGGKSGFDEQESKLPTYWPFLWVVKYGSHGLVQGPLCNSTAARKGLMQVVALPNILKQGLVLFATLKTNATHATQGLDLLRKVDLMTRTLVETRRTPGVQIMERSISKPWDISLCSEQKKNDLTDNNKFNPCNFWGIRGTYRERTSIFNDPGTISLYRTLSHYVFLLVNLL